MEKVLLVGILTRFDDRQEKISSLEELGLLCKTAGCEVIEKILQKRDRIDPAYYIGKGKVQELAKIGAELNIDTFVFDEELKPTHIRNIVNIINKKVIDRSDVVLDIFAKHAKTKAAKIEVELAQLKYRATRLRGKGIELSQLAGGIGTMGPGERKLEIDRRRIRERIWWLEKNLRNIEKSKEIQSSRRKNFYRVALVGYTNAGKTSIMNKLTHSNLYVDDKLFSTLDSTTRILTPDGINKILITDTIGFLRKLPHGLIASFKSTLQEALEADLRLHVIDVSAPDYELQLLAGNQILEDLKASHLPTIYVFNKIDISNNSISYLRKKYPDAVFVSALKGDNITSLKDKIFSFFGIKNKNIL